MSRRVKEGRILSSGVIKAAEIASGLGMAGPEPEARAPKLSPAQQRAKEEGKPVPPSSPDFETTVIAGGRDAWEFLGKPALEAPPGSPDGTPVPVEPPPKPQPQRTNWDAIDGPPKLDAAEARLDAAKPDPSQSAAATLIQSVKAHAAKVRANFEAAKGTPREAAALAAVKETTALVERTTEKL